MKKVLAVILAASFMFGAYAEEKEEKKPAASKKQAAAKDEDKLIQEHNLARPENGGRISLEFIGKDAGKDRQTTAEQVIDGNVHTRCVVWGAPLAYKINFVDKLPVAQINFICSDAEIEESPKDIEVIFSDGMVIKKTLEIIRPKGKNNKPRQVIETGGKLLEWVEVKVLSNYEGLPNKDGKKCTWGGIGEIEVITPAELKQYTVVADYNAGAPAYIKGEVPRSDYSNVKVFMPSKIALGEHPGIYLSRAEIVEMREKMKTDPRSKPMLEKMLTACDEWLKKDIKHPDPNIPAQMKDRGDAQAKAHDLMSKMAGWLGWAYQITDNEEYAKKAKEILTGYAKLYPNDYKEHKGVHPSDTSKIMAQRLSEAMWLLPLIQSYDMIYNSKCMSDEDKKLIENDLIGLALRFIDSSMWAKKAASADETSRRDKENPKWRTTDPVGPSKVTGNWTNFYNAAYIQGGIVLKDQNWIDIGAANAKSNLHFGIGEDGMWLEGAIGYQLFARQALIAGLEPLARQGIDLYSFEKCKFKNLFDSPFVYAFPDGTAPGIHDSGRVSAGGGSESMAFDFGYLRYRDLNYGTIVNQTYRQIFQSAGNYFPTIIFEKVPEQQLAGFGSLIFDNLGYAVLRGEDGGSKTYELMDYGPHGGGHGHPDKLNIILYADGDELTGEPQTYRYEDNLYTEWEHPTIGHWTMCVDKNSQTATTGKLLVFYDKGNMKIMRGVSDGAYPGVILDRTFVQMPGYFADIFKGWGPAKHTFDYPLCFRGTLDQLKDAKPETLKPMEAPAVRAYNKIMISEPVRTEKVWTGIWSRTAVKVEATAQPDEKALPDDQRTHPANTVKASLLGSPDTVIYAGKVPGGRHEVVARREGREAVFAAVIEPYMSLAVVSSIEKIEINGPVPACGIKVKRTDEGTDYIIVRFDRQENGLPGSASVSGNISTDALVSVIRLDKKGKVLELGMSGGMKLSIGDSFIESPVKPDIVWKKY